MPTDIEWIKQSKYLMLTAQHPFHCLDCAKQYDVGDFAQQSLTQRMDQIVSKYRS